MRRAAIAICLLQGLALPAAASAHGDEPHGAAAARTLRDVARQCAGDSPRREARLHRVEALVLGPEHAADHARERAQDRREACTPSGRVRPAFARTMRRAAAAKREQAVGPPGSVGQWSGSIPLPGIVAIHSTLMPNGKVLFFYNNPSFGDEDLGKVMVWDPVTRTGVRRDVPANIWCAGQTLLADGRVLVVGGNLAYETTSASFKGLNEIWIFDPWTETWTQGPDMRHGRWYPTATRMADGRVLITAGWDESGGGASANNRDIEVYTPAADGHGPGTVQVVGSEDIDYYPHQYQLPDGRVLIAGPRIDDTFYVDRDQGFALSDAPDLNVDRVYGFSAGVLLPGPPSGSSKVMLIGGATTGNADGSTATTESFDAGQAGATWQLRASLPQPRRNVNGVITPDGDIVAVGGNTTGASNGYQEESLLYDPGANSWSPLASQVQPRGYHSTALLLPDASVLSAGDDTDPGGGPSDDIAEIFSPPYLFHGARPAIASAPDSVGYGQPFTIGSASQVSRAVLMAPSAVTHGNDMNQRHVELAVSPATGGVVAASPPSPNVAPPGPYMLFLIDAQGVPSTARWVWVGVPAPNRGGGGGGGGGGAAPGAGGPAAGAGIAPPRVKRLRVSVGFTARAATVRFAVTTSAAFRGTLGLYPVTRGTRPKALRRALVSRRIAGKGGRNVVLTARFSTAGKRFPLKLRVLMRLRDPRGGADRVIARSLLLRRSPPSARFLG